MFAVDPFGDAGASPAPSTAGPTSSDAPAGAERQPAAEATKVETGSGQRPEATVSFADPYLYPDLRPGPHAMSRDCPAPPCLVQRRIGRLYVLKSRRDGSPMIVIGPCWPMFLLTFFLIAIPTAIVLGIFARDRLYLWIPASLLAIVTLGAFIMTGCRDPGIVKRHGSCDEADGLWDSRAQTYRPRHAILDQETGIVAEEVDHFCPWTGTLIAKGNLFAFHVFTTSLCILCPFVGGILIWGIITILPIPNS